MRIVFVLIFLTLTGCNKHSSQPSSLVGNWRLSSFIQSVMGNGSWQAADSLNPKYIQFNADGTLTFSASDQADFNSASRYQVTSDTTMIFYEEYGTTPIKFLTDTVLTMYPGCMEECVDRYTRSDNIK